MALGASFGTAWSNFGAFLIVALVLSLPSLLLDLSAAHQTVSGIVNALTIAAMTSCGIHGAIRAMAGEKIDASSMLSRLSRPEYWMLVVLCTIENIAIGVGMIFLLVPGFILLAMWIAAAPVMLVEHLGIIDSLKRSTELTKGSRWTAVSTVVAASLLCLAGLVAVAATIYVVIGLDTSRFFAALINWALGGVFIAFLAPLQAVIYVLQRQEKEGVAVADMARQL